MNLNEFMTSVLSIASSKTEIKAGITEIKHAANRKFVSYIVSPNFTLVRFDATRMQTAYRTYHFNMLVRLLPGHPYYRSWLKPVAIRCTEPLYEINLGNEAPKLTLCEQPEDADIRSIADAIEKRIIDKIVSAEQYVSRLHPIKGRYGLSYEALSELLETLDFLQKNTVYDRDYFLNAETRTTLLPE